MRALSLAAAFLVWACSSTAVTVGSNDAATDVPKVMPDPDDSEACRNGEQLPIVGTWTGYIENFKLSSGSDAIQIIVSSATAAQVCGKVKLGTADPPPPATDPEVGYPPGYSPHPAMPPFPSIDLTEGFRMTIVGGRAVASRLTFEASSREFWKSWCSLQTPIADVSGAHNCLPLTGGSVHGTDGRCFFTDGRDGGGPVDCGKLVLCNSFTCDCTASGCTAGTNRDLSFDLRISGREASGSLRVTLGVAGTHNVFLTQSP